MLVADNQYAALGLMLLATLARVRKLVLPLMGSKAEDVEGAMDIQEHGGLDLGEVIQRNEIVGGSAKEDEEDVQAGFEVKKPKEKRESREQEHHLNRPIDSTPTKRPKKKRKKGDAFDDIFDSLI
jgi:ribonuclease MRP protein subunit RMP1